MSRKNNRESRHHKIAKSRGGDDNPPNNENIKHNVHQAIHTVFGNEHTLEKIDTIITMDFAILTSKFKKIIMDILGLSPQEAYEIDAFRNKEKYNDLKNNYKQ